MFALGVKKFRRIFSDSKTCVNFFEKRLLGSVAPSKIYVMRALRDPVIELRYELHVRTTKIVYNTYFRFCIAEKSRRNHLLREFRSWYLSDPGF